MSLPTLETERLLLRPPVLEDFEGWIELYGDAPNVGFIGGVQPREVVWRLFMTMAGPWMLQGFSMFSVIEKASGRWIGRLGPWQPDGWPGTEIGWSLLRSAWGKGYATEGATAAIDWAFDVLGWTDVIHTIDPANRASQKLAERLGSRNRGAVRMPPPLQDRAVDAWGQTRAEWQARRR